MPEHRIAYRTTSLPFARRYCHTRFHQPAMVRAAGAGFTLFEVGISLMLVTLSVISVLILLPQGVKAEQIARMRVIAGAKALEIIDSFATSSNANPSGETEAPDPWDVPSGYRVFSADLEARVNSHRYGIMPVPLEIAQRLDSDNDEISNLLAAGGQLFYSQANGATGLEESRLGAATDALTQRLVFAVVGYAQNNHVTYLPQKAWPYLSPYPSPPGHGEKKDRARPADQSLFDYKGTKIGLWEGVGAGGPDNGLGSTDGDIAKVYEWDESGTKYGFKPYGLGGSKDLAGATRYLQSALWYAQRKGLGADWYAPMEPFSIPGKVAERMALFRALPEGEWWKYVQAFRFLSHAATCMTRHKKLTELGGQPSQPSPDPTLNCLIPEVDFATGKTPEIKLTHDKIVYYYELGVQMAMHYAACQPYDWGAPRPVQRSIFMDHPLIEYDLWSPPLSGTITNTTESAQQWRPVAARPIANVGRSMSFPDRPILASLWGAPENFTLVQRFEAAERCRQLVFWSVDWKNYEDFETAPSGPIDASKYQFAAPIGSSAVDSLSGRMGASSWIDHHIYQFRNPEKAITFMNPGGTARILNQNGSSGTDMGSSLDARRRFLARWGADRNFNGQLDRGNLPTSIRLRAIEVSRYNFYDPRLTLKLR